MQQSSTDVAIPCAAVLPRSQSAAYADRCDFCHRSADEVCWVCDLDVCVHHGSYSRTGKVFCMLCRRHVDPRCLDCGKPAQYKCARCPQRLCKACVVFCSTVHADCEGLAHCKDCAARLFQTCDICHVRVCETLVRQCYHCRAPISACSSCISNGAHRCDACLLVCCARCLGAQCNLCTVKRCVRCNPSLVLPRCMALGCLQPVCTLCTAVCNLCGAHSCANHTPPTDKCCSARPSQS